MKLYHFNPNNWGGEYYLIAENKINAHKYLLKHISDKIITEISYSNNYCEELELWSKVNPMDETTFHDQFTLDEYDVGTVIETEIA